MDVLLTNDDGIQSKGLRSLHRQFSQRHQVTVVAPDRERSAVGHGITLLEPLRAIKVNVNGGGPAYAISGKPVDCIKLGVLEILEKKPDIVISGINPGANIGINLNYSGTVSAAKEAAIYGLYAIAVSIEGSGSDHFDDVSVFIEALAEKIVQKGLPQGTFLNVNFPNLPSADIKGIRITRQDIEPYEEYFDKRLDPRNMIYYWQGLGQYPHSDSPDTDAAAIDQQYISITPIQCDMTAYKLFDALKKWDFSGSENTQKYPGDES
jgi:5'-nucleotidase